MSESYREVSVRGIGCGLATLNFAVAMGVLVLSLIGNKLNTTLREIHNLPAAESVDEGNHE